MEYYFYIDLNFINKNMYMSCTNKNHKVIQILLSLCYGPLSSRNFVHMIKVVFVESSLDISWLDANF